VDMTGTCRSFSNEVRKKISENLENIVCEIARGYQATAKLDYFIFIPTLVGGAFSKVMPNDFMLNLIEGIIRIAILFAYIVLIS
ncbi:DUF1385 domain-containing protein, partial [Clostridioides difficile]